MGREKESAYFVLIKDIIDQITKGVIKSGEYIPPENTLTRKYGISRSTVRKALDELVRRGYLEKLPGKGTIVKFKLSQVNKKQQSARNIVLVLLSGRMGAAFYNEDIYNNMYNIVELRKWNLTNEFLYSHKQSITANILSPYLAGICIVPTGAVPPSEFMQNLPLDIPIVILGRKVDADNIPVPLQKVFSIAIDNFYGVYRAIEYLIMLGHKQIHCFVQEGYNQPMQERLQGYIAAFHKNGLEPDKNLIYSMNADYKEVYHVFQNILSSANPPTAVYCGNVAFLSPVLQVIEEKKLRIPDDISIITFDDVKFAANYNPPITVIRLPIQQMVQIAINNMYAVWNTPEKELEQNTVLKPELVLRGSCSKVAQK